MSGSVEAVPPSAACEGSIEALCAARLAEAAREEPIVGLSDRGVSVAGIAAREGLTAKRARLEMVPQWLGKVESAPGNDMAPAALDSQYLVEGGPRASRCKPAFKAKAGYEAATSSD